MYAINITPSKQPTKKPCMSSTPKPSTNEPLEEEDPLKGICDHSYICQDEPKSQPKVKSVSEPVTIMGRHGLYWNPDYKLLDHNLILGVHKDMNISEFLSVIKKSPGIYNAIKRQILVDLENEIVGLTSRTIPFQSVMLKYRNLEQLTHTQDFLEELLREMDER